MQGGGIHQQEVAVVVCLYGTSREVGKVCRLKTANAKGRDHSLHRVHTSIHTIQHARICTDAIYMDTYRYLNGQNV